MIEILKKLNINLEDLNEAERQTFERWSSDFESKPIDINSLKDFLNKELTRIDFELSDYKNDPVKDLYLKMQIRNYKIILGFINAPEMKREAVKAEINKRFNINL